MEKELEMMILLFKIWFQLLLWLKEEFILGKFIDSLSILSETDCDIRFDLPSYVLDAFKVLKVDVELLALLHIGEFQTNLAYTQQDLVANTDSSLTVSSLLTGVFHSLISPCLASIASTRSTNRSEDRRCSNFELGFGHDR